MSAPQQGQLGFQDSGRLPLNSGIHPQTAHGQRCQKVNHMPDILGNRERTAGKESSYVSLHSRAGSLDLACYGVENVSVFCLHGHPLHVVAQSKERRDCVGEVEERRSGYHGNESKIVWDRCRNDERYAPPDGHDGCVEQFAWSSNQGRCVEPFDHNVVVEHFDTNVPVEPSGN